MLKLTIEAITLFKENGIMHLFVVIYQTWEMEFPALNVCIDPRLKA